MKTILRELADDDSAIFAVAIHDGDAVEVVTRTGMWGTELAARLRIVADAFEHGHMELQS